MSKGEIIQQLKTAHEGLREILAHVSAETAETVSITPEGATVKDILSHLIDWNIQFVRDFEDILNDSWIAIDNDTFNKASYIRRKHIPYQEVYAEWDSSIDPVIAQLQSLTPEQWGHACKGTTWHDGSAITIPWLFDYKYNGESHELGHGKEIQDALSTNG